MRSFSPAFRRGQNLSPGCFAVWSAVSDHIDSTRNTWDFLNKTGRVPHLLWNPSTGEVVEGISLDRRATFLPSSGIQVAVVATAENPFTDYDICERGLIFKALESLGVPEVWPFGPPSILARPIHVSEGSLAPGHYSANQLHPDWTGVGSIDVRRLHGTTSV